MACISLKDVTAVAVTGLIAALIGGTAHANPPQFPDSSLAVRPAPISAPAGAHPVGRIDTEIDGPDRELMVSAWYPAAASLTPAPYIPASGPAAELRIAARADDWMQTPAAAAAMVGARADASSNAPTDTDDLPVLIVSPGMGTPRWILSGLASDLASHGIAVVVMDHTGETPAVEFPDRRIVFGDTPAVTDTYMRDRLAGRVADTRLTIDHLAALPIIGAHIDLSRVAVAGHSYGGTTALQTMAQDPRVRAAISIDGPATWPGIPTPNVNGPALLLNLTGQWVDSWNNIPRDTATILDAGHYSASDLCQFGAGQELCGTANIDRAATVSRDVIGTWLDHLFRDTREPRYTAPELVWQTAAPF